MQVSVETGEGLERRLLVDLPASRVNAEMDRKLKDLARHARLDGFRPGKVPLRTIRQRFGSQVRQETYGELIQATLYEAASQQQLNPAGEPRIEIRDAAEEGGFGYTAVFEVVPEVTLAALEGRSLSRPVAEVGEDDIDAMIEKLRQQRTVWNDVERPARDGDTVHIDFEGKIEGEAFDGGTAQNVPLVLGSGAMIDGFESGLVGAAAGESRTVEVDFPEDYRAEHLAGKRAVFEVKVLRVAEPQLPEVDEDFVKAFGVDSGTVEDLRQEVRRNMEQELRQKLRTLTRDRVMDLLIELNPMEIPKAMVDREAGRMKQQMAADMQQRGQSAAVDLPIEIFADQARRRVHLGMLVGEIIRAQGIEADEDDLRQAVAEFAESYEKPQEVIDHYLQDSNARAGVENMVLENKVVDWVLGQLTVDDESRRFAELMENTA
jgi:trigger factor